MELKKLVRLHLARSSVPAVSLLLIQCYGYSLSEALQTLTFRVNYSELLKMDTENTFQDITNIAVTMELSKQENTMIANRLRNLDINQGSLKQNNKLQRTKRILDILSFQSF